MLRRRSQSAKKTRLQANVLVDGLGHAKLTDYGFALINYTIFLTAAEPAPGNTVWLAPEIIKPGTSIESKPADVFALAMLAFEVFTGKLPFENQGRSRATSRMLNGARPQYPQNAEVVGLTTEIWEFLERCWHQDLIERPTIDEVVRTWERFLGNDESVQEPSNDLNRGEPVPDKGDILGEAHPEQPTTHPSKQLSSSADIANSPTRHVSIFRHKNKILEEVALWIELFSGLDLLFV